MRVTKSTIGVILGTLLAMLIVFAGPAQANKIRIALAETPSDELAAFFVALDRAQKNGLDYDGQLFLMRNWQFKRSSVVKWTLDLELHTL